MQAMDLYMSTLICLSTVYVNYSSHMCCMQFEPWYSCIVVVLHPLRLDFCYYVSRK